VRDDAPTAGVGEPHGVIRLRSPAGAGTTVLLRVTATDGRRGGALLDGPVELEVIGAQVPLVPWEVLGLRALGGQMTYRTRRPRSPRRGAPGDARPREGPGHRRRPRERRARDPARPGPWRAEVTDLLRPGSNTIEVVVRGTLAGYLDDASPTRGVYAGQARTGMLGLVVLRLHS
jgi:hypothetical protein